MPKKDYRPEIHVLFEKLRSEIVVKSTLQILRLEFLEKKEDRLLKMNSAKALEEIKQYIREKKKKVYVFPHTGKKFTVFASGKIKTEVLR